MPVLRTLPVLGGTGILPVIDRRDTCPTGGFVMVSCDRPIMGGYEIPYYGCSNLRNVIPSRSRSAARTNNAAPKTHITNR